MTKGSRSRFSKVADHNGFKNRSETMNHDRYIYRLRQRRRWRNTKKVRGDGERPRLTVFRSHKHIYAQVIDDESGKTMVSASTRDKEVLSSGYGGNADAAGLVGKAVAERAKAAGIEQVRFDRGAYKYHGRVAALADAAREGGLQF